MMCFGMDATTKAHRAELKELYRAYRLGDKQKLKPKEVTKKHLDQPIRSLLDLSDEIAERIEKGVPTMMARLGGTEGQIAGQYCERTLGMRRHYEKDTMEWMYTTSGFFADDYKNKEDALDEYSRITLEGMASCDYLSATFPPRIWIPYFFRHYATNATPTFSDLGPYLGVETEKTWLRALKGKRVLVINSFADSIAFQYQRKDKLVKSSEFELPDFADLQVYKTLVTQCGERPFGYKNFFEAYRHMENDIRKLDFDVAFVGAGAYGFPLAVEIKKMGKIALETCGSTPLFFGVYGERNVRQGIAEYMTDAWIRPMEEPPKEYKKVEGGCYW